MPLLFEGDSGRRRGATGEELTGTKALKAEVRRLEVDNAILKSAPVFFVGPELRNR